MSGIIFDNYVYTEIIENDKDSYRMKLKKRISNQSTKSKRCPFIHKPFKECYCLNLRSINIQDAIFYCIGSFEECEIYNKYFHENFAYT